MFRNYFYLIFKKLFLFIYVHMMSLESLSYFKPNLILGLFFLNIS